MVVFHLCTVVDCHHVAKVEETSGTFTVLLIVTGSYLPGCCRDVAVTYSVRSAKLLLPGLVRTWMGDCLRTGKPFR